MATSGKSSSGSSKKTSSAKSSNPKTTASQSAPQKGKADAVMAAVKDGEGSAKDTSDKTLILTEEAKATAKTPEKGADKSAPGAKDTKQSTKPEKKPEAEAKPKSDPAPAPKAPPVASEPEEQRSGFFPMVLGGAVAAAIGFGIALIAFPEGLNPNRETARTVAAQGEQIDALEQNLAETSTRTETQLATANAERAGLGDTLGGVQTDLAALSKQVAEAPQGDPTLLSDELAATLDAQKSEIARLQGELEKMASFAQSQIAEAEAEQLSAEQAEARVKARGALNVVRDALASGDPFADALPDIAAAAEVPETLANVAETGVPSLQALQGNFSDSARTALSASVRESAGSGATDRVRLFLQDQFSARSLTPREGDDPDAVLSRAEDALRNGNLAGTLETLAALPEAGQAAFAEWVSSASTRQGALDAYQSISNALSEN